MAWDVLNSWYPIVRGMTEGAVYHDQARMVFVARWQGMDLDWFALVRVGAQGGLKGARLVCDPRLRTAKQLLVFKVFSPATDGPFPLLELRLRDRGIEFHGPIRRSLAERPAPSIPQAQARAQTLLASVRELFSRATPEELRAQLSWLRTVCESNRFPDWMIRGEVPDLTQSS